MRRPLSPRALALGATAVIRSPSIATVMSGCACVDAVDQRDVLDHPIIGACRQGRQLRERARGEKGFGPHLRFLVSMFMPMMFVWIMRVRMAQRCVRMQVRVRFAAGLPEFVLMLVMRVVDMRMIVSLR